MLTIQMILIAQHIQNLHGGTLTTCYKADTNPTKTTNGIKINGCSVGESYANNQLVVRSDLQLLYQALQSITISAVSTAVTCCATNTTLSATAYFNLKTKGEDGTTDANANTSASVTATYSDDKDFTTIEGNKISFDKNSINYPTYTSASSRSTTVTGSYKYSGVTKEDTVEITQNANYVGNWVWISDTTTSISVSPSSMSFESGGGTKDYSVTRYYNSYYEKYDSCGAKMDNKTDANSVAVTPSASCTGDFECTSSNVSIGVNEGSERSGTLTVSYDGYTDTCSLSQGASQAGTYTSEPNILGYSYHVQYSWDVIICSGGTAQYLAKLLEYYSYTVTEKDHDGSIISEETKFGLNEYDKTRASDWTISRGTINAGHITVSEANPGSETIVITGTASWSGYSDTFDTEQEGGCSEPSAPVLNDLFVQNNLPGEFRIYTSLESNIYIVDAGSSTETSYRGLIDDGGSISISVPKSSIDTGQGVCSSCHIAICTNTPSMEITEQDGEFRQDGGDIWWVPTLKFFNGENTDSVTIKSGDSYIYVYFYLDTTSN